LEGGNSLFQGWGDDDKRIGSSFVHLCGVVEREDEDDQPDDKSACYPQ